MAEETLIEIPRVGADYAWAVKEFGRTDGSFDLRRLRKLKLEKQRELRKSGIDIEKLEKMRMALDHLLEIADGSTSEPFSGGDTIFSMRGKSRAEFVAGRPSAYDNAVLQKYKSRMWFDFRNLQIKSDGEMASFGKELIEAGIAKLPFDECVFSFPFVSKAGEKISANYLLEQQDRKIISTGLFFFGSGKPVGFVGKGDIDPPEAVYYAVAVLASRQTVKTIRALSSGRHDANPGPGTSYVEVTLSLSTCSGGPSIGTHASPRLHWRRGHIRRIDDTRTTWVRPTLVGVDSGGIVVHDYKAA